ncbi:MAG: DUF4912 domain-containing protein [Pirellulales bacterium]|nr:DUF4912 domain-containing protein [Pirellulales bacterium]
MITAAKLRAQTVKDLAAMAKREGVAGWHSMRKEQLIKALLKCAKDESNRRRESKRGRGTNGTSASEGPARSVDGRFESKRKASQRDRQRLVQIRAKLAQAKDLAHQSTPERKTPTTDRLVVMVRDPYWLHAYWELTPQSIERAQVAMGRHWHEARPVLRLYELAQRGTTEAARTVVRDIEIHGGVNNWYLDVQDPPKSFQLDIGYVAAGGRFLSLARSNVVSTVAPKKPNGVDGNWAGVAEDFDRIYAMSGGYENHAAQMQLKEVFEEQLRRPMGTPMATRFGLGAEAVSHARGAFVLEVDAEMVVFGATEPGAHVTLRGRPIQLNDDGTFTLRFPMPDRRQVLPVVASSGDGVEQRTVVLAVERNTKVMEPVTREMAEQ